jgi:hypothetical protein
MSQEPIRRYGEISQENFSGQTRLFGTYDKALKNGDLEDFTKKHDEFLKGITDESEKENLRLRLQQRLEVLQAAMARKRRAPPGTKKGEKPTGVSG